MVWEKKGCVSCATDRLGSTGPNPAKELSSSGMTRFVEGVAFSSPLVGRPQWEVQEQVMIGYAWEKGQSSIVGAALQRPVGVKANLS